MTTWDLTLKFRYAVPFETLFRIEIYTDLYIRHVPQTSLSVIY